MTEAPVSGIEGNAGRERGPGRRPLTAVAAAKARHTGGQRAIPDGVVGGLALRLGGVRDVKTWTLSVRVDGKLTRVTIGSFPHVGVEEARAIARRFKAMARDGLDPRLEHERERRAVRDERARTFNAVAGRYLDEHARKHAVRSVNNLEGVLLRNARVRKWGERPIGEVRREHVRSLIAEVEEAQTPFAARGVWGAVRSVLSWATQEELIPFNPATRLRDPVPREALRRERELSEAEIRRVWLAAGELGYPFGSAIRLLLATGARREEVASLHWDELDLAKREWLLPSARAKNKREHLLPLSDVAAEVLEATPRRDGYVFASREPWSRRAARLARLRGREPDPPKLRDVPVSGWSKAKVALNELMYKAQVREAEAAGCDPAKVKITADWRIHDIRRTVVSNLGRLGVRGEIISRVVGHTIVGVTAAHYQRHDFAPEKRAALDLWGKRLREIVEGPSPISGKVVDLASARLGRGE
jgi:integrase